MAIESRSRYSPNGSYDVRVHDETYLTHQDEPWPVTIYQPQGTGPFPALLQVHGGAWYRGSRSAGELFDLHLAATGMLVAAIDFRQAPDHPYPAQVADVNYGTRWLKAHAPGFNADPSSIGLLGSSSGGHTSMLSAMRPHDPRYSAIPLTGHRDLDASVLYILAVWPVLDPYARFLFAKDTGNDRLAAASENYFLTQDAMKEGNPQHILERGEKGQMPPTLIIQGTADENVPMSIPENFVTAYRAAGGHVELEEFPGMPHGFGRDPGPETDRALELMKAFAARQLTSAAVV